MAATRNKNMYAETCAAERRTQQQSDWLMSVSSCANNKPAFPVGVLAPKMPASTFSNNAVDIEGVLFGIGANNFYAAKKPVNMHTMQLQPLAFFPQAPVYVPVLPKMLVGQRPL